MCVTLLLGLICCALAPARAQASSAKAPADQFFAGIITELEENRITVSRTVLGKQSARSFLITPDTRIEGKPKVSARVTVKFVSTEDGDRAVHIIVRLPAPKKK